MSIYEKISCLMFMSKAKGKHGFMKSFLQILKNSSDKLTCGSVPPHLTFVMTNRLKICKPVITLTIQVWSDSDAGFDETAIFDIINC